MSECSDTLETVEAKREFVMRQTEQAKSTGWVNIRHCGMIPVWIAFRCLYCGEYFNQSTAEQHFGITVEDFFKRIKGTHQENPLCRISKKSSPKKKHTR